MKATGTACTIYGTPKIYLLIQLHAKFIVYFKMAQHTSRSIDSLSFYALYSSILVRHAEAQMLDMALCLCCYHSLQNWGNLI